MTTEKYTNIYRHSNLNQDQIRGMIRDLNDPGNGLSRDELRMKREALERLQKEKSKEA